MISIFVSGFIFVYFAAYILLQNYLQHFPIFVLLNDPVKSAFSWQVATEMESPSKMERRQAWALSSSSSRRKFTVRDAEHRSPTAEQQPHFSLQDDVFVDGEHQVNV